MDLASLLPDTWLSLLLYHKHCQLEFGPHLKTTGYQRLLTYGVNSFISAVLFTDLELSTGRTS